MKSYKKHRNLLLTLAFSAILLGLIIIALDQVNEGIVYAAILATATLAVTFHFLLPGSGFFSAVFANSVGIYACVYVFFISQNFYRTDEMGQVIGFVLPLLGFLAGVMWKRKTIIGEVRADSRTENNVEKDIWRAGAWVAPLLIVSVASFMAPLHELGSEEHRLALLTAMTIICLTALLAAEDIAIFLLDTGLLFRDFFENAFHFAKPAFAFFTCYSLIATIYGCLFTALDRYSADLNFLIGGLSARRINLGEGLYLSVVTLSTVGYGDLSANSPLARIMVVSEIFVGVLILLFGVQAILNANRRDRP